MTLVAESAHSWMGEDGGRDPVATIRDDSHDGPVVAHIHDSTKRVGEHHPHLTEPAAADEG